MGGRCQDRLRCGKGMDMTANRKRVSPEGKDINKKERINDILHILGLCPEARAFVFKEMENKNLFLYHCQDLLDLGCSDIIKSLSPDLQIGLIQAVTINRKKIKSRNEKALAQALLASRPDCRLAEIWLGDLQDKISELRELFKLASSALDHLDHREKTALKQALAKLSIENLDVMIKIRHSLFKETHQNIFLS